MTPRLLLAIIILTPLTWFFISWALVGTAPGAAAAEAVGAVLGVLVLISVVGTLRR